MNKIRKIFFPSLIILVGILIMVFMSMLRENPGVKVREQTSRTVRVKKVSSWSGKMEVSASGILNPADTVNIMPQVGGKLIYVSENVRNGSFVKKGEVLFSIAPREYELRVDAAKAQVAQAETALQTELEKAGIAKKEWKLYNSENPEAEPGAFLLREPQIRNSEIAVESARASLEVAELNLKRTIIRAPFDGFVAERFMSRGQIVSPGVNLARIISLESEIAAGVKLEDSKWLPNLNSEKNEISAEIFFPESEMKMKGKVRRAEPVLDDRSKMVNYVVELDNKKEKPVKYGSYARIILEGVSVSDVYRIKASLLDDENRVYLAKEGKLDIKKVEVMRVDKDTAYVVDGITAGDMLVTDNVHTAIPGIGLEVLYDGDDS